MVQMDKTAILFSNKMNTLLYLKDKLSASYILDIFSFSVDAFKKDPADIASKISNKFIGEIIIRSSATSEDQSYTKAGHFCSVQHINSQKTLSIINGINVVIDSYTKDGLSDSEFIFVQKQLDKVILSGVALSFEPREGKPYFLVNCDNSGITDSVTSGKCNQYIYIARDFKLPLNNIEAKLCYALLEIEEQCNNNNLNVEFAITDDEKIYILQVRRFLIPAYSGNHFDVLNKKNSLKAEYSLKKSLLSDMAFWNPSEIIGNAPHPLDYSLYRYLVTDYAWNKGIADIGYFPIKEELMTKVGNKPYIKLDIAFFALTPSSLDFKLREKLVNYYSNILKSNKKLHDKIEFRVVYTCYDFSTTKKLLKLRKYGFTNDEITLISKSLYQITKSIIEKYDVILENDLNKLNNLNKYLIACKQQTNFNSVEGLLSTIAFLLSQIRDNGIIPFARQARCAFIARSLCTSLVDTGDMNLDELDTYMQSIHTVTKQLQIDVNKYKNNKISLEEFNMLYGHLRSNTYDISSETYKEIGIQKLFDLNKPEIICNNIKSSSDIKKIDLNFPDTRVNLDHFIKTSITQRENFKFVFTKALSYVIDLLVELGRQLNLSRDDISFLPIDYLLGLPSVIDKNLTENVKKNKATYKINSLLELSSVIAEPDDFDVIRVREDEPNFITNLSVEGELLILDNSSENKFDISGKIIVMQNADPGFDWIFAGNSIAGLITQYGGMASHMAIRCMEFGIPAAIGCGEFIYNKVIKAKSVVLDCIKKKVVVSE